MGKKRNPEMTLGLWLIEKVNTADWRAGKVTGTKHPEIDRNILETLGREDLLKQAAELEKAGIITVDWKQVRTDIGKIHFPVENMARLCRREGVENPRERLESVRRMVEEYREETQAEWLRDYYSSLLSQLERGTVPANAQDEIFLKCLNGLAALEKDTWKRKFSTDVLGQSKLFKNSCEKRALTVLRNYSPKAVDSMTDEEVLAEHKILTYSQTLEWKGCLSYRIDGEWETENRGTEEEQLVAASATDARIDTSVLCYGTVINAQTLTHAVPVSLGETERIITIENKASYESMVFDPKTLYIYTHGFFSPKERAFLEKVRALAKEEVRFYHWSDMDYGGIRIFQFLRQQVFPALEPLYMGEEDFERALREGKGIPLPPEKREKLIKMDAGALEGLKQCILKSGMEIEQENLL